MTDPITKMGCANTKSQKKIIQNSTIHSIEHFRLGALIQIHKQYVLPKIIDPMT